ncbi:hypothetical protein L6164_015609 [Bauhinia variegata]|uniref:Uncharacterized protein n=1 Tax=Bauhinia variegata TaxID=167791 RepID=A0ACB9NLQ7_BAUVA|nr:hypothetical protein L6164_015609 [Bauhinia variegata]
MGDPYYRYGTPTDRASIPRTSFAGYLPSETPSAASHHASISTEFRGFGSDYLQNDINLLRTGGYGEDIMATRVNSEPVISSGTTGANVKGYASVEAPELISQKLDSERPISKSNYDSVLFSAAESNILFVGGLPNDCCRREVGHLFRPFIGYKDIKVVHKEPRRSGDKATVLCFVEFVDGKCALTAMEALQGYKFDDKKPNSPTLKIQFAHFPFHPPPDHGEQLTNTQR